MFWDNVSGVYDLFETVYNGKVYRRLGQKVAEEIGPKDVVLECACGTGAISSYIAAITDLIRSLRGMSFICWMIPVPH